jgi:hypothetical protein
MKIGRTLVQLAKEVEWQANVKRDFIADTRSMRMTPDLRLQFGDQDLAINELAHDQIGGEVKIPAQYYDRMRREAPELLANNVETWFKKYPAQRMVRTLDGGARAFLSDRFRPLDNYDLLEAVLPPLSDLGVEILSCDVTERKLYLKVVDQRIKKDLPVGWTPENRGHQRFDTLSPAMVLSNSEVGCGALAVQTSVYTGGCTNLAVISERSTRKYHVGARHDVLGGEEIYAMLSEQTRRLTDAALWAQVRDMVKAAFDRAKFDAMVGKLEAATQEKIVGDPVQVIEVTSRKFGLNGDEGSSIMRHLIEGGDLSKYGLHSAITRAAQDVESYDRASDLERVGGQVIELGRGEWKVLAEAA